MKTNYGTNKINSVTISHNTGYIDYDDFDYITDATKRVWLNPLDRLRGIKIEDKVQKKVNEMQDKFDRRNKRVEEDKKKSLSIKFKKYKDKM